MPDPGSRYFLRMLFNRGRIYAYETAVSATITELDDSRNLGEQRVVSAYSNVRAGFEPGAPLTDQDRATRHMLAGKPLYSESLGVAVSTVT